MPASAPGASVDSNSGVKLGRAEWPDDGAPTDAEEALSEQRFRDVEANPHAFVPREETKLRLMASFKR